MISSLIDPPRTMQDRLRNMEFVHAGESPLYGRAADRIDTLEAVLRKLVEWEAERAPTPEQQLAGLMRLKDIVADAERALLMKASRRDSDVG